MKTLAIVAIIWLAICGLILFVLHIKSRTVIKSIISNALLGFGAIFLINVTQKYTGVNIPLNWWTVGGGGILGLPAVCGTVLLQLLI